jgi:hypothetical protein
MIPTLCVGAHPYRAGGMARSTNKREILERTVRSVADRARDTYWLVEEAHEVDLRDESGLAASAKRLRMELLQTKAELERELGRLLLYGGAATGGSTGSAVWPEPGIGRTQSRRRTATSQRYRWAGSPPTKSIIVGGAALLNECRAFPTHHLDSGDLNCPERPRRRKDGLGHLMTA